MGLIFRHALTIHALALLATSAPRDERSLIPWGIVGWSYIAVSVMRGFASRVRCRDSPSGELTDLGSLADDWSWPHDVNEKGEVVGDSAIRLLTGSVTGVPFYRDVRGRSVALPLLAGSKCGEARALNERGVVVGTCTRIVRREVVAELGALWRQTRDGWTVTDLGTFAEWNRISAGAIDEQDRVFGSGSVDGADRQAFVWIDGVFTSSTTCSSPPRPSGSRAQAA